MQIHQCYILGICSLLFSACSQSSDIAPQSENRGRFIFVEECSQCHGLDGKGAGPESLGLGAPPPDLTGLSIRNDGSFPREFVRRFVLGLLENDASDTAMPEFSKVGLIHVYPEGGADGEVLERDFADLLEYLEAIQVTE